MNTRNRAAVLLPALLLACTAAVAAEPASATDAADITAEDTAASGLKVGIDPKTRKRRPLTAAESAALDRAAPAQKSTGVRSKTLARPANGKIALDSSRVTARGGRAMKLPLSEMSHVVAYRDAAGNIVVQHGDGDTQTLPAAPQEVLE